MTVERDGSTFVFECDIPGCDASEEFERCDFGSAWAALKRQGWKAKKIGTDWVHGCPRHGTEL